MLNALLWSLTNPKRPCSHCGKGVTGRSRAISCDSCDQWTYIKCAGVLSNDAYDALCSSGGEFTHLCNQCTLHALPFDLLSEIAEDVDDEERSLDGIDNESDEFKCFFFIEKACILTPGVYCQNWTN